MNDETSRAKKVNETYMEQFEEALDEVLAAEDPVQDAVADRIRRSRNESLNSVVAAAALYPHARDKQDVAEDAFLKENAPETLRAVTEAVEDLNMSGEEAHRFVPVLFQQVYGEQARALQGASTEVHGFDVTRQRDVDVVKTFYGEDIERALPDPVEYVLGNWSKKADYGALVTGVRNNTIRAAETYMLQHVDELSDSVIDRMDHLRSHSGELYNEAVDARPHGQRPHREGNYLRFLQDCNDIAELYLRSGDFGAAVDTLESTYSEEAVEAYLGNHEA